MYFLIASLLLCAAGFSSAAARPLYSEGLIGSEISSIQTSEFDTNSKTVRNRHPQSEIVEDYIYSGYEPRVSYHHHHHTPPAAAAEFHEDYVYSRPSMHTQAGKETQVKSASETTANEGDYGLPTYNMRPHHPARYSPPY